jgi:hypothetical protein
MTPVGTIPYTKFLETYLHSHSQRWTSNILKVSADNSLSRTPTDRVFAVGANTDVVANYSVPLIMPNYDQILPDDGPRDTMVSSLCLKFSTHNELVREISSFSFCRYLQSLRILFHDGKVILGQAREDTNLHAGCFIYIQRGAPMSICDATSSEIAFPTLSRLDY